MHTEAASHAPRILTESGESSLRSVCDLPKMEVTTRRHRELCPHASIGILANTPHPHRVCCPEALPIPSRALDTSSVASARPVHNAQIGCVRGNGWLTKKAVSPRSSLRRLVELSRAEIQPKRPAVATELRGALPTPTRRSLTVFSLFSSWQNTWATPRPRWVSPWVTNLSGAPRRRPHRFSDRPPPTRPAASGRARLACRLIQGDR